MKKVLILAALIAFTGTAVMAEEAVTKPDCQKPPCKVKLDKMHQKQKIDFDKKLKLTDEQKAQAKVLRENGREKMKPLMEQQMAKRKALKDAINSNKDEKTIEGLKNDLKNLDRQAREIRKENMKEFESILTKKQKKELEKIKQEGRKKFEQMHKNRPQDFNRGQRPAVESK